MLPTSEREIGWVCPTCGRSLNPSVIMCPLCVTITPDQPTMPSPIPYIPETSKDGCRGCSNGKGQYVGISSPYEWSNIDSGGSITTPFGVKTWQAS